MRYSGLTESTRKQMLEAIGVDDVEGLFASIPADARMQRPLEIAGPVGEADLLAQLDDMKVPPPRVALVGAGIYPHFVPAAVDQVVSRSEWLTSYTPYQPELAQGTCVMYYEYQTYSAMLTGHEVANAGMYDGSTGLIEAVLMARRIRKKASRLYVSEAVHPEYLAVMRTYLRFHEDIELTMLPVDAATGRTTVGLSAEQQREALAIVLQSPNFFGVIEDFANVEQDAFVIWCCTEAMSLPLLPPPRSDIAVGEMQSLGIPMQLGGPTAGFLATSNKHVRQLPGRLVGKTIDADGKEAFSITLATREQFIRREKATSNICTASGLMCLRVAVYLSLLGRSGVEEVARTNARTARFIARGLEEAGLERVFSGAFFNEMVFDLSAHPGLYDSLAKEGFVLGVPLARFHPEDERFRHRYLVTATEVHHRDAQKIVEEVKRHVRGD